MTLETRGRHLRRFVIRIGRAVVIGQVAIDTLRGRAFKDATDMALLTRGLHMLPGQWERRRIVIKARLPVGGRMALETGGRHLRGFVIRIGRAVVIRQVAIDTLRGRAFKDATDMALLTRGLHVLPGQRERRCIVIKARLPVGGRMALETGGRHLRGFVIRIGRAVVIRQVAVDTLRGRAFKDATDMALLTRGLHMLPG